jgi:hypothetical protein
MKEKTSAVIPAIAQNQPVQSAGLLLMLPGCQVVSS